MTLLERTRTLEANAKRQREQAMREEVAAEVRARTSNLEKLLTRLVTARSRAEALRSTNHVRSPWPAPPVQAFAAYDPAATSPVSVESTRRDEWQKLVLTLDAHIKKVEKLVEQDIKRAKREALSGISAEEILGYQLDPSTEGQAKQLLATHQSLTQRNWETLSGSDILDVLRRAGTFREDVTRLRESGASEELRAFLAQAREGRAPLDALTDALRAELSRRKLLGRLCLVLK